MLRSNLLLASLIAILAVAGCLSDNDSAALTQDSQQESVDKPSNEDPKGPEEELDENRKLWEKNRPKQYEYRFLQNCECEYAYRLIRVGVDENVVVALAFDDTSEPVTEVTEVFFTIDDLFETLAKHVTTADVFEVKYNANLGYPERVVIDMDAQVIDDEVRYFLDEFSEK